MRRQQEGGRGAGRRRVLVVAYYFPPMGLSGVQRVAKFVKYLPAFGWDPTVLTTEPAGYFAYDPTLLREVQSTGAHIVRTPSWDPTRLFGKETTVVMPSEPVRRRLAALSQLFFVPDNKVGWLLPAIKAGRALISRENFDAIFSSAPPYTAHLVGAWLSRWSGLPLVTDFRDDWTGNPRHVYPTRLHRHVNKRLERYVLQRSCLSLTINERIRESLQRRHADAGVASPVAVLPQGFDPADFPDAPEGASEGKMRFLYAGVFYDAQTPDYFLHALADVLKRRPDLGRRMEAVFVGLLPAASHALIERLGLGEVVRYEGYLSHEETVMRLQEADILWMTIGDQPGAAGISTGKLYEYLGARKPILALVPEGEASATVASYGAGRVVPPGSVPAIGEALEALYDAWERGSLPEPDEAYVRRYDRVALAGQLAQLLAACTKPL